MWTFRQNDGFLLGPDGTKVAEGYSGKGEGKNNPSMQQVRNVGPIPCGIYFVGVPEANTTHGPYAIPLFPAPTNQMFDRSGFWCHGDSIHAPGDASEGCIILSYPARVLLVESDDKQIQVVSGLQMVTDIDIGT